MTAQQYDSLLEQLLEKPYYVIDFLPIQVPADCGGQYFAVEQFYLDEPQVLGLYPKFANLLVQLNCYYELAVGDGERWSVNMPPKELFAAVSECSGNAFVNVLIPGQESLITLYAQDLYMTLYHPSNEVLDTVTKLASALGLFVRKGEDPAGSEALT